MSLVVLSNNKTEDGIVGVSGSIDKPFQFRNNLSSTYELPANAQVALQSAKVNLDGSIIIGNDNRTFFFWFGVPLSHLTGVGHQNTIQNSICEPIKIELGPDITDRDSFLQVNPPDLAPFLQKALRKYSYHPQIQNRMTVTPKYTNGLFVGYDFQILQSAEADGVLVNYIPPEASILDAYDQRIRDGVRAAKYTYAVGVPGGTFYHTDTRDQNNKGAFMTADVPPLSNKKGKFIVDISDIVGANSTSCCIGLSRDTTVITAAGDFVYPGHILGDIAAIWGRPARLPRSSSTATAIDETFNGRSWCRAYFDYAVVLNRFQTGVNAGKMFLEVYHCCATSDASTDELQGNGLTTWKIKKMDYGALAIAGGLASNYDFVRNDDNYQQVEFIVSGDQVSINLLSVGAPVPVMDYDATRNKDQNLTPMEQGRWSLFPVLGIYNRFNVANGIGQERSLTIATWNGTNSFVPNWTTDGGWLDNPNATWNRRIDEDADTSSGALSLRNCLDYNVLATSLNPYKYGGADGVTPFGYTLFQPRLIVSPSDLYVGTNQANMGNILGFAQTPVATVTATDAVTGTYTIVSANAPNVISIKSIFCRLDNFTQQSVNGKRGSTSQIIAHLPRYVQSGQNNYGPLYLEANNLIYLDLNNPEPMKVNTFDISMVYADETLAEGLVGTTIVCLHFREKPK